METKTRVLGHDKEDKRVVNWKTRTPSVRACLRTFGGTPGGTSRFGAPLEVSGRCRRWFRESRVWVTRWRADNARNFGFEFCATIVTARHAPRPLLDVVPRVAMTFGFDRVVVRVVGISITSSRDWDLIYVAPGIAIAAEFLRRFDLDSSSRWWVVFLSLKSFSHVSLANMRDPRVAWFNP